MKITFWSVMAGTALALVGCMDRDFNTPDLLNHLRILAVQADPPQPKTGESTTVRALVYQPPANAKVPEVLTGYRWRWCPTATSPQDPSQCPIDQPTANMLFAGIPDVPPLDLRDKETATFTNPFPASLLTTLCRDGLKGLPAFSALAAENPALAQAGEFKFKCGIAGFPVTIQLEVSREVAGEENPLPLRAMYKVYLPVNDAIALNHNPVVGALNLREAGISYPIDEAGTWSAVRGGEEPLLLDLPLSSSEPLPAWKDVYPMATDDEIPPNPKPNEQLNVFWFTEGGRLGGDHKGGDNTVYYGGDPNDRVSPFSNLLENTLKPYKLDKYDGATVRLYAVVLDSRGGVSWTTGVLRLVEKPEGRDGGMADGPPDNESPPDAGLDSEADADVTDTMSEVLP